MKTLAPPPPATVVKPSLNGGRSGPRLGYRALAIVVVVLVAAAAIAYGLRLRSQHAPQYVTSPAAQGTLVQTITAAGTINPQNLILVGTQVSGTISELDVDYNSPVRAGQVMAKIDPTSFRDALAAARASETQIARQYGAGLASAQSAAQNAIAAQQSARAAASAFASANAQVGKTRTALGLAQLTVRRDRTLLAHGFIAQNQLDTDTTSAVAAGAAYAAATFAVDQARAQLKSLDAAAAAQGAQSRSAAGAASAVQAQAGVYHAQADQAGYNLRQSVIKSPVAGTVIARNVSVGQTVAASFQTPTLFSIAQDLSKMQVDISVGEPDIGSVRPGDVADFTVLAYPNRTFHGRVNQVRRNPTTVNNVVTYDTVVDVANRDGALYPGMTGNATIHVAKAVNSLIVSVAALQYTPPQSARAHAPARGTPTSPWGMTAASATRTVVAGRNGRVFALRDGRLQPIPVRISLVNGTQAAVVPLGTPLRAGDALVVADDTAPAGAKESAAALVRTASMSRGGGR